MHRPTWLSLRQRHVLRRAGKVAVAATLATLVAQALGLQNPWFATMAAIVAMEITIRTSLRSARNALIGAVVGAGAGLTLAVVAKEEAWAVTLVVLVVFIVFGLLRMESAGRQAALVASVIVLVPERLSMSTTQFAGTRLIETVIGIGVALLVNAVILPPRAHRRVRRELSEAYVELADLYGTVTAVCLGEVEDPIAVRDARRRLRAHLQGIDAFWDEAMAEHPPPEVLAAHWRVTTRRIWEQCAVMASAVAEVDASALLVGARSQVRILAAETTTALERVGHAFTDDHVVPVFPDLEAARADLVEHVRRLEDDETPTSYADTLQVLGFVNAMSVIAQRLDDAAESSDPESQAPLSERPTEIGPVELGPAGPGAGRDPTREP